MAPSISIVIPCYNMEKTVGEAIKSVLDQSYGDYELIVFDNASTDGSLSVIESFSDPRIKVVKGMQHLETAYKSGNYAVSHVSTPLVMGVSADDRLTSTAVEEVMAAWQKLNKLEVCMVSTQVAHINEDGTPADESSTDVRSKIVSAVNRTRTDWLKFFRGGNCFFGATAWRTDVWRELQGFDESFEKIADLDMMIRALRSGYSFYIVEKPLYEHRMSLMSATAPNFESLKISNEEMKRIITIHYPPIFNREKVREKKVILFTPYYMAQGFAPHFASIIQAVRALTEIGVQWDVWNICGDSYVERVKNSALMLFLKSDGTDLMIIDSDIQFDTESFLRIALSDHDLIGGSYPMKNGWDNFVGVPKLDENKKFIWDDIGNIRAEYISGGFSKFSRRCVEKMADHYKDHGYTDPTASFKDFTPALFECAITDNGMRATEDYVFCKKWSDIGGEVWIDPTAKTKHYGINGWGGCFIDHIGKSMMTVEPIKAQNSGVKNG